MSYSHGTPHFNLPLTQGSDKRDWSDTNQAFEDLDAAVYQAGSDATGALSAAQGAQTTANSAATDAASAISTANAASASAATASEAASLARTEAQSAQSNASSAVTAAQSAASQASNADTVALAAQANIGTMSNLNTQDKSSLVAAINEVLNQIGGGGMPTLNFASPLHVFSTGNLSYTATKDCWLGGSTTSTAQKITVANTDLFLGDGSANRMIPWTHIKSGQTVVLGMAAPNVFIFEEA